MGHSLIDKGSSHRPTPSCAGLSRASTSFFALRKTWMAGPSPAMTNADSLIHPEAALGQAVERTPDQPVGGDHEDRHHHDAEHDARMVARLGRLRDIGPETGGLQPRVAPARDL